MYPNFDLNRLNVGQELISRLKHFNESNMQQKTWTDLLGKPQGNESVDGNDIVREVDLHKFRILWSFNSPKEAERIYTYWTITENNLNGN